MEGSVSDNRAAATVREPVVADPGKAWRREHGIPVVPAFDGFRALAIVGVAIFHSFGVAGTLTALGDSSFAGAVAWSLPVSLTALFIISGFVIYMPTVAQHGRFGSVRGFAIRRAARLFPGYVVALVVTVVLLALVAESPGMPGLGTIAAHLTLLHTEVLLFDSDFSLGFGVIPPVWTLSVELLFYCLLPLVAAWYFRRPLLGLALGLGIFGAWHFLAVNADDLTGSLGWQMSEAAEERIGAHYASQFPAWTFAFACGMTAAWAYVRILERSPRGGVSPRHGLYATLASGAVLLLLLYLIGHRAQTDPDAFQTLSLPLTIGTTAATAALFLSISFAPAAVQLPFTNATVRWLADISYGIYLIHFAVIWFALRELGLPQGGGLGATLVWVALVISLSIAFGYLSARYVERPVRRWAHRYGRRASATESSASPAAGVVAQPTSVPSTRNATRT